MWVHFLFCEWKIIKCHRTTVFKTRGSYLTQFCTIKNLFCLVIFFSSFIAALLFQRAFAPKEIRKKKIKNGSVYTKYENEHILIGKQFTCRKKMLCIRPRGKDGNYAKYTILFNCGPLEPPHFTVLMSSELFCVIPSVGVLSMWCNTW